MADSTWQLTLEWPSSMSGITSPSSYTSAFDMGYDMVAECSMDTILAYNDDDDDGKNEAQMTKFKVNCILTSNGVARGGGGSQKSQ